jgi:hypothetical protein
MVPYLPDPAIHRPTLGLGIVTSNDQVNSVVGAGPDGCWVRGKGRNVYYNRNYQRLYGALSGRRWYAGTGWHVR